MSPLVPPVSERDHSDGPPDAPVTLVEYGDFECPHCGAAFPILRALCQQFGHNLRFVFRNFPLTQSHPHAQHAAEAAETAGNLGDYWGMHDTLFTHQDALDDQSLLIYAEALDLNVDRFAGLMRAHSFAARVREDFMSGIRSGVNGTPTFFINGDRFDGSWRDGELTTAIEQSLVQQGISG